MTHIHSEIALRRSPSHSNTKTRTLPRRLCMLRLASGWALKRPALTIGVKPGVPPLYSLAGWDELDRYASRNQPLWCAVRRRCIESGVSEIDGLKLLCAALVDESEARKETIIKYVEHGGFLPPNGTGEPDGHLKNHAN